MEQQEFMPPTGSHGQQSQKGSPDKKRQSKARSHQSGPTDMPKYEHPSTFEASIPPIPPYSYRAQETQQQARQQASSTQSRRYEQRTQTRGDDPDAFENGYRPHGPYTQHTTQQQTFRFRVPQSPFPWLRQQSRTRNRTLLIVFIVLAVLGAIQAIGLLLTFAAFIFGILLVILFLLAFAFICFIILRLVIRHYWRSFWGR
jgi:hypothetical protein